MNNSVDGLISINELMTTTINILQPVLVSIAGCILISLIFAGVIIGSQFLQYQYDLDNSKTERPSHIELDSDEVKTPIMLMLFSLLASKWINKITPIVEKDLGLERGHLDDRDLFSKKELLIELKSLYLKHYRPDSVFKPMLDVLISLFRVAELSDAEKTPLSDEIVTMSNRVDTIMDALCTSSQIDVDLLGNESTQLIRVATEELRAITRELNNYIIKENDNKARKQLSLI